MCSLLFIPRNIYDRAVDTSKYKLYLSSEHWKELSLWTLFLDSIDVSGVRYITQNVKMFKCEED